MGKGTIPVELLEEALKDRLQEKKDLENKRFSVRQKTQARQLKEFDFELIRKNLQNFQKVFEGLDDNVKPQCLRLILQDVIVHEDKVILNVFDLPEFVGGSKNRQIWLPGLYHR